MRWAVVVLGIAAVVMWGRWAAIFSWGSSAASPSTSLGTRLLYVDPRYRLEVVRDMPEEITALSVAPSDSADLLGSVYVGTSPIGGVYSFNFMAPTAYLTIGEGLGDYTRFGMCEVNSLAVRDLDRDGISELIATTSQVVPRGRPRVYVWSLGYPRSLKCLSRPEIESSWSHGIAFLEHPGAPSLSTFVTFCGHGEIVEYQLNRRENEAGFLEEVLGWKKVGQLGSSGEWILSADVDDDGQTEVCVASGYARGKAAIQIYSGELAGSDLRLKRTIDEGGDSPTSDSLSETRAATESPTLLPGGVRNWTTANAR
jgi:hypothetical protein